VTKTLLTAVLLQSNEQYVRSFEQLQSILMKIILAGGVEFGR